MRILHFRDDKFDLHELWTALTSDEEMIVVKAAEQGDVYTPAIEAARARLAEVFAQQVLRGIQTMAASAAFVLFVSLKGWLQGR